MNDDDNKLPDERFTALLADCDAALAAGETGAPLSGNVTPELRPRLERGVACLQLLEQVWPRQQIRNDAAPSRLGRFEIRRELGRGGFGIVLLAYDPHLKRDVALKVPRADALTDPELRERFHKEAHAAARLDHPNIVSVFEAGEAGPICYIASAYCPGVSLAHWLKEQKAPVPFSAAAELVATLAEAVQHAHDQHVVHRDLKPANVLLQIADKEANGPDQQHDPANQSAICNLQSAIPKITDFGLAKVLADESAPTRSGVVLGTPSYMSPEQAGGKSKDIGRGADVYALGAILYELLTGRPPFLGETDLDTVLQVQNQEPLPPLRLRPKLPRDLETICLKCLRKAVTDRYACAADLAGDLRRFLAGEAIQARPVRSLTRAVKWSKRRPALAALLGLIVFLGTVGLPVATILWRNEGAARQDEANQRRRAEASLAARSITLARLEWMANETDHVSAKRTLEDVAPEYRDEEWLYLHRSCNAQRLVVPTHGPSLFSYDPGGQRLAATMADRHVWICDARTGKLIRELQGVGHSYQRMALQFHRDGATLTRCRTCRTTRQAKVEQIEWQSWDTVRGKPLRQFTHKGNFGLIALDPIGRYVAAWDNATQELCLWNLMTGEEIRRVPTGVGASELRFSPDGGSLAASCGDTVRLWDVASGQLTVVLKLDARNMLTPIAFDATGQRLALARGEADRIPATIQIWDLATRQTTLVFQHHAGAITSLAFSPDGRHLASASHDKTVILWDAASGKEVMTFRGHRNSVLSVGFSPDGLAVASGGNDGSVRTWDVSFLRAPADPPAIVK